MKRTRPTLDILNTNGSPVTRIEYTKFQEAYDFFNSTLFAGTLTHCLIVLQRKANMRGHYAHDRFSNRAAKETISELALNPDGFIDRTDEQILSTLVHEMVHCWQYQLGNPPSRSYHNKEWAAKMKEIGLQPSSTGMVGGKETGSSMSHYTVPNGRFARAYAELCATGFKLDWQSTVRPNASKPPTSNKVKFTCHECAQNAWGAASLQIDCHLCGALMVNRTDQISMPTEVCLFN